MYCPELDARELGRSGILHRGVLFGKTDPCHASRRNHLLKETPWVLSHHNAPGALLTYAAPLKMAHSGGALWQSQNVKPQSHEEIPETVDRVLTWTVARDSHRAPPAHT